MVGLGCVAAAGVDVSGCGRVRVRVRVRVFSSTVVRSRDPCVA